MKELTPEELHSIAVIGIGCRFPGADSPQQFWDNMAAGLSGMGELSEDYLQNKGVTKAERFDENYVRTSGVLNGVEFFDAQFFKMPPSDVRVTDPQQRLLLECAYEAMEDAGYASEPEGCPVAVYASVGLNTYFINNLHSDFVRSDSIEYLKLLVGNDKDYAATMISHQLNLTGPSVSLNTACSSSLVAIHMACRALLSYECDMALAGGAKIIVPHGVGYRYVEGGIFSPDGQIRAFDADAQGPAPGNGVGVVLLKRLEDALADKDPIYAVIRGSAVNNDGGDKMSFTAPSQAGQSAVIAEALAIANVSAETIGYVEAHGTGTALGDPIEISALSDVYTQDSTKKNYCAISSVKTNLGHLDVAAGVAGFIKAVGSLYRQQLFPSLNFERPNPQIDFDNSPFYVNTRCQPWISNNVRRAAVSAFGFGGTNAHLILEQAKLPLRNEMHVETKEDIYPLCLSAKTPDALRDLVRSYHNFLQNSPEVCLADLCYTASVGRNHYQCRAGFTARNHRELEIGLCDFLKKKSQPIWAPSGVMAWSFTGQGAQYPGMGEQLYRQYSVFRKAIDQCASLLEVYWSVPLTSVLWGEQSTLLSQTQYTQPAIFAFEYALAQLWRTWTGLPACVLGHSIGEYAAACIAGIFSLDDAIKMLVARGQLMEELTLSGKMLAVFTSEVLVQKLLAQFEHTLSIAAINGPEHVTISGTAECIDDFINILHEHAVDYRPLDVSRAFHSTLMQPMLSEFERVISTVTFHSPQLKMISTVTGQSERELFCDKQYWVNQIEQCVQFEMAVHTLHREGTQLCLEIGPVDILNKLAQRCVPDGVHWLTSIAFRYQEHHLLEVLTRLYTLGINIHWCSVYAENQLQRVHLPTYPFQRQRYWVEADIKAKSVLPEPIDSSSHSSPLHPLLGRPFSSPLLEKDTFLFESQVSADMPDFLSDHVLHGQVFMPASAMIEMILEASVQVTGSTSLSLLQLSIYQPLQLPRDGVVTLQVSLVKTNEGYTAKVFSFELGSRRIGASALLHAECQVIADENNRIADAGFTGLSQRCTEEVSVSELYDILKQQGIEFGHSFRLLQTVRRSADEAFATVELPEHMQSQIEQYSLHPALIDACFQTLSALDLGGNADETFLFQGFESMHYHSGKVSKLNCAVRIRTGVSTSSGLRVADILIMDSEQQAVASVLGVKIRIVPKHLLQNNTVIEDQLPLYNVQWQYKPRSFVRARLEYLPSIEELMAEVIHQDKSQNKTSIESYFEQLKSVESMSIVYVLKALLKLGWGWQAGESFTTEQCVQKLGVIPKYQRLMARILAMLTEVGFLVQSESHLWHVVSLPEDDEEVITNRVLDSVIAELNILHRCGPVLDQVLIGAAEPLDVLFPDGDVTDVNQVYEHTPLAQRMNQLVTQTVIRVLDTFPLDQEASILEIGAGTGGTTAALLPSLQKHSVHYDFTDISPLFVENAKERFSAYDFVSYQTLNIESDLAEQGFSEHQYDMIIASNVLHATREMHLTMAQVHRLLKPGGILVMREVIKPQRWGDLSFGLTDGWWHFTDIDLRPDYPLLSGKQWQCLLQDNHLTNTHVYQLDEASAEALIVTSREPDIEVVPSAHWLIFADHQGVGESMMRLLTARGDQVTRVTQGDDFVKTDDGHFILNPSVAQHYDMLSQHVPVSRITYVVHLWNLDLLTNYDSLGAFTKQVSTTCASVHALETLLSAMAESTSSGKAWVVTRGAQQVSYEGADGFTQSLAWGIGKTLSVEYPDYWGGLIDLDSHREDGINNDAEASCLWREITANDGEEQLAFRGRSRMVARLTSLTSDTEEQAQKFSFDSEASYLITGGLGKLGLSAATWMIEQGAKHLILVGRNSPSQQVEAALEELRVKGCNIYLSQTDVTDRESMTRLFTSLKQTMPEIKGVIHAAGISGGVTQRFDINRLDEVLQPKVAGAWYLHELTKEMPLDFFILYSSMVSVWGASGQAHYSAANAFLGAFGAFRRQQNLAALTVYWGPWKDTLGHHEQEMAEKSGARLLRSDASLNKMFSLIEQDISHGIIVDIDWEKFKAVYQSRKARPLFTNIVTDTSVASPSNALVPDDNLQQILAELPPQERLPRLTTFICKEILDVLGLPPEDIVNPEQGFFDMGMDSLLIIDLRKRLSRQLEGSIAAQVMFDYPSVSRLAEFILSSLLQLESQAPTVSGQQSINAIQNESDNYEDLSSDELMALLEDSLTD
ncbi:Phthiocerol synthesis polyketide synthase type I PpsE [Vibrio ruber DSM 16370]|uniref:Phthiocerol synthesis polyketide synthase type I PpsE n=1 Tax=Vibrio ruber (strain DSM 16370 / JCM 11486 / BCRC 17186 / CECT 7878 / LMG 23124 / VR1) TaxID=1123498 RepID=A0A1R4LR95_VIBR1|nr:type I polyketide synthase [Vibrio ruber]SJN59045.1 Phthiocerol synthesis polyketide synthase type I PpsE [Vibrio ruber DSM 16370]